MCLRVHSSLTDRGLRASMGLAMKRAFAEPGVEPHYAPDRGYRMERVELDLDIDPVARTLAGTATLHVRPLPSGMGEVAFDLDELEVEAVTVDGAPADWRQGDGKLRVRGLTGPAAVAVRYRGSPRRGLYFVGPDAARPDHAPQAWTQCQDEDAHFVFPCFDHPSMRQSFGVTVRAPAGFTVISNGSLVRHDEAAGEWVYEQAQPIPAYLFSLVVAELDAWPAKHGGLALRYLVPAGTPEDRVWRAFGDTPRMIGLFERLFQQPFAWDRYDQVVVWDFIFGGMENVAATTMTDMLLTDEAGAREYDAAGLVAHELAHQWFGDLVTCQDWSQAWLNEGWATYCESLWLEEDRGADFAAWYRFSAAERYFEESDGRYARPVVSYDFREPIDVFDRHLYEKGGCVLHTLRAELGDAVFFGGVAAYLAGHRMQGVHTLDFQRALERHSGRTLDRFFNQWVHSPGFPDLVVRLSHDDGLLSVTVEQSQAGEGVPSCFHLRLPIEVHTGDRVERVVLPVRERSRTWAIPCAEEPDMVRVDPGFGVLARLKVEAPGPWLTATLARDACPVGRIRAARALAEKGTLKGLAEVAAALSTEPTWMVRAAIADTLGKARGAAARDALVAALGSEADARVRRRVTLALGQVGGEGVAERLLAVAVDEAEALYARGFAAVSLARLRSPLVVEAADALLSEDSWAEVLRSQALLALGASDAAGARERLLHWTGEHATPRAQAAAAEALGAMADRDAEARRELVDKLIDLARDGSFRVQLSAIAGLGVARDPRAIGPLRQLHSSAPDGRTRRVAYEAMADLREGRGDEGAVRTLRDALETLERRHDQLRERMDKLERP